MSFSFIPSEVQMPANENFQVRLYSGTVLNFQKLDFQKLVVSSTTKRNEFFKKVAQAIKWLEEDRLDSLAIDEHLDFLGA